MAFHSSVLLGVSCLLVSTLSVWAYYGEDCCAIQAKPFGTGSAGTLLTSCKACSYTRSRAPCSECIGSAYGLPGVSLADRVKVADLCMSYMAIQPDLYMNKYLPCIQLAAKKFPTSIYEPYARCMDCVTAPCRNGDPTQCHNVLWQETAIDVVNAKLRELAGRTGPVANLTYINLGLSFPTNALEPFIDNQTMFLHSTAHHNASVKSLNAAISEVRAEGFRFQALHALLASIGGPLIAPDFNTRIRNFGGSHYNHAFFWTVLAPPTAPSDVDPQLAAAIQESFGGMGGLIAKFNATALARFGSGWAWLVFDPWCDKAVSPNCTPLIVTSTPNQDNPLMKHLVEVPGIPLLAIDMWEHSHYLLRQNRRNEYIDAFWNVVNWKQVAMNFKNAQAGLRWNVKPDGTSEYV